MERHLVSTLAPPAAPMVMPKQRTTADLVELIAHTVASEMAPLDAQLTAHRYRCSEECGRHRWAISETRSWKPIRGINSFNYLKKTKKQQQDETQVFDFVVPTTCTRHENVCSTLGWNAKVPSTHGEEEQDCRAPPAECMQHAETHRANMFAGPVISNGRCALSSVTCECFSSVVRRWLCKSSDRILGCQSSETLS